MKITDEMIERFSAAYCERPENADRLIISEEAANAFFGAQETADILDYTGGSTPRDEVYLTQAMIMLAERAGLLEEWMDSYDPDGRLWDRIRRKLRKEIREKKKAEAEKSE